MMRGPVADPVMLRGLHRNARNLGLPLLAVMCPEPGDADASASTQEKERS
jgi:hypothetical protein